MTDTMAPRRDDSITDERLEILKMVEGGTIRAEEGARLLDALRRADRAELPSPMPAHGGGRSRNIRLEVNNSDGSHVNLVLPLALVDVALRLAQRFAPKELGDLTSLRDVITSGASGPILDVAAADGGSVEIVVDE